MAKLFDSLPPRSTRESDSAVVAKAATTKKSVPSVRGGTGLYDRIATISALVNTKLGKYADQYVLLRDVLSVGAYFKRAMEVGECAIDTETDSLNPMLCKIAGVCLYVPGEKPAYIPINHVSYVTGVRCNDQVEPEFVSSLIAECERHNVLWYCHNGKFDLRVCRHKLNVNFTVYWDTMLAARCLNENESAKLKSLHLNYCESQDDEELSYDKLFSGISFTLVPINVGYLYAAGDPVKTYELATFQKQWLNETTLPGPYYVFRHIEMPLISVVADMEDTGVSLDLVYAQELSAKYNEQLAERQKLVYSYIAEYTEEIDAYKRRNPSCKLSDPISINSPVQMAILFYDILGCTSNDKKKPRGTGKSILKAFGLDLANAVLAYKETSKLLSTYIDKMPKILNPHTGRIHCNFNQGGAATGRFSSSEPNMQNIPSHNKEIRKMFVASAGHVLISCDFSQQEPRTLAHMSNDFNLIQAYCEGKDIYAWIASSIYKIDYDACKEKWPDGTDNPEGKKRRDSVKSIILGIMYGRGAPAIAEQLKISTAAAQKIIDQFYNAYPAVHDWMNKVLEEAKRTGYVVTAWGRKRRLPDVRLPKYSFEYKEPLGIPANFDPLDFTASLVVQDNFVDERTIAEYTYKLNQCRGYKAKLLIIQSAKEEGIVITDNTMKIADAERQCVNSIIQGSSADMTKIAMYNIGVDEYLKERGCKLIIQVHDEVIAECPREYAEECAARLSQLMVEAAASRITVPMKCDAEITTKWYGAAYDAEEFLDTDDE